MPETGTRYRSFGVEIEFEGDRNWAVEALRDHGLECVGGYYSQQPGPNNFIIVEDGSLRNAGCEGGELKTPVLNWYSHEDRHKLTTAVRALREVAVPHPAAGIHVHVGGRDLTPTQVARTIVFYAKFEDAFWRMASSGWREIRSGARHYCRPLTDDQIHIFNRAANKSGTERQIIRAWESDGSWGVHGRRYKAINLAKYWTQGTIEFRLWNSSMNDDRIMTYVAISVGTVQDAIRCKRALGKAVRLGDMFSGRANPDKVRGAFAGTLRWTLKGVENLTASDIKLLNTFWKDSVPQQPMGRLVV